MSSTRRTHTMRTIRKFVVPAVWVGLAIAIGYLAWQTLGLTPRIKASRAVGNLMDRNHVDEARKTLLDLNDRKLVIGELTDALNSDEDNVAGKLEVLATLHRLKETGAIRRAIGSDSASTRRAAAAYFANDESLRPQVTKIVLDWLTDTGASDRRYAAQLSSRLQLTDAIPVLRSALERTPRTTSEENLAVDSLNALASLDPDGIGDIAYRLASDGSVPEQVRGAAFYALSRAKDVPKEKTRALALKVLKDPAQGNLIRSSATTILQRREMANDEVWDALEQVLVSRDEEDYVVQRLCLNAIGVAAPMDRLERVLLRPEVYGHDYFGVRIDVATAVAAMNLRKPLVYDVMLDYLVYEDPQDPKIPKDTQHLVRAEGWATLWTLTGMMGLVDRPELFKKQPKPLTDETRIRQTLWDGQWRRAGFTRDMWEELRSKAGDLEHMKRVRDVYTGAKGTILDRWKAAAAGETTPPQDEPPPDKPGD